MYPGVPYQQPMGMPMQQMPGVSGAPATINTMTVGSGASGASASGAREPLLGQDKVLLGQKTSECCRCCCCQPNIHWRLYRNDNNPDPSAERQAIASISEDAPYVGRCCSFCAPGSRPITYSVHEGEYDEKNPDTSKAVIWTIEKPQTCGINLFITFVENGQIRIPCCCNLPYLEAKGPDGASWGKTEYLCCLSDGNPCIDKFMVSNPQGTPVYAIRPDTCCLGCCPKCQCGGQGRNCCRVPFYIRDPKTNEKIGNAQIADLWAGLKRECCTKRNLYELEFPPEVDERMKATLIGSALLIDLTLVEQGQD